MTISERKFMASQAFYGLSIGLSETLPLLEMVEIEPREMVETKTKTMGNMQMPKLKPSVNKQNIMLLTQLSYMVADAQIEYDKMTHNSAAKHLEEVRAI